MYFATSSGVGQPNQAVIAAAFTPAEEGRVKTLIDQGIRNENALANRVYFDRHPTQRGQALTPGSAQAREWISLRSLVRPKLAAVPFNVPSRPCCILAPEIPLAPNIANPASLGIHRGASEVNGLIYTGRGGFIDLGHLREECDLTEFVWTRLQGAGGAPTTIPTVQGEATITRPVPRDRWLTVARAIAFDDGLGHEIFTYDLKGTPGGHNSAFSPDDLCSNFVGTVVARQAIGAGGRFDAQVTAKLKGILTALGAQTPSETRKAFDLINGRWVAFSGPASVLQNDYLKRRNFSRVPFKAGHPSDTAVPAWLRASFGDAASFYSYKHTLGKTIPKADFAAEIQRIRADAKSLYGNNFDKP
jgi:hypothetical protein